MFQVDFFEKAFRLLTNNFHLFWYGIKITLLLAFLGTMFGLVIGLVLGGIRAIAIEPRDSIGVKVIKKVLHWIVGVYVWFFRGTPMMVQAMFLYYSLRPVLGWGAMTAGIVIISVNTGAYMAEIIRSGLQSVDSGQSEAAKSLGMSTLQTMVHIIFPQAIRNAFPSIGNQLIVNIKDSSMLSVIWVLDLFFQSQSLAGSNYRPVETYFVATVLYLILTTIATLLLNFIEKRMNMKSETRDLCA